MALITLYKGTAGLNTVLDPKSINSNAEQSLIEFSQAVNISIDDRGLVSLRNGSLLLVAGDYHSIFCDGGYCFFVQERENDAAIMRYVSGASAVGVRSGLSKNKRMAWGISGNDTFYSNGIQNGYIRNGVSYAWPIGTYYGADTDVQFAASFSRS